ncbi:Uncharacterized protein APZ42_016976 [Daphnia magna]|uniref:Uncharacterized protein n=1 Tax=Daphnia magna TaxID=35525 RepID=A0A0P5T495_9CRUS|nr:Uncharacterized protein APZ42_016976 [Daphnia magna]
MKMNGRIQGRAQLLQLSSVYYRRTKQTISLTKANILGDFIALVKARVLSRFSCLGRCDEEHVSRLAVPDLFLIR